MAESEEDCRTPGCCTCPGMERCPRCGYTEHDKALLMDHHLCAELRPAQPKGEDKP